MTPDSVPTFYRDGDKEMVKIVNPDGNSFVGEVTDEIRKQFRRQYADFKAVGVAKEARKVEAEKPSFVQRVFAPAPKPKSTKKSKSTRKR